MDETRAWLNVKETVAYTDRHDFNLFIQAIKSSGNWKYREMCCYVMMGKDLNCLFTQKRMVIYSEKFHKGSYYISVLIKSVLTFLSLSVKNLT